jgi:hypothetical protein
VESFEQPGAQYIGEAVEIEIDESKLKYYGHDGGDNY